MKNETNAENASKVGAGKARALAAADRGVIRAEVPVDSMQPDPNNRAVDEADEDFATLVDSVKVMGVLVAVQAQRRGDGSLQIIDGERRWRAARRVGLASVPCDVWPDSANPRDVTLAGVVMNEQRQAHSCLAVARRLRAVKNQFAESQEQVAGRTGLPLTRVKAYLNLFNASDRLLSFFEETNVSLKTAVELVRHEKALGEIATRRLLERHADEPLAARDVETLRKRGEVRRRDDDARPEGAPTETRIATLASRLEAAIRKDPASGRRALEALASALGLHVVEAPASSPQS